MSNVDPAAYQSSRGSIVNCVALVDSSVRLNILISPVIKSLIFCSGIWSAITTSLVKVANTPPVSAEAITGVVPLLFNSTLKLKRNETPAEP